MRTEIRGDIFDTVREEFDLNIDISLPYSPLPIYRKKTAFDVYDVSVFYSPTGLLYKGQFNIEVNFRKNHHDNTGGEVMLDHHDNTGGEVKSIHEGLFPG